MEYVELGLSLYALGVVLAALFIMYDVRKMKDKGYILKSNFMKGIVILSLWSWVVVIIEFKKAMED